jgi:hypothetical protein
MKFFNLDCHVSVIADIRQILESMGHEVDSWSVSGHNWVFGKNSTKVDIVNQDTWHSLDKQMSDEFYERYKDELSKYDAFICTYPPSFAMLYEKFDKPIIIQIPIRYEVPFHKSENNWNYFNQYLRDGIDKNKIFVTANSEYDKQYFEFFVNRHCELIPSICEYTNTTWTPTKEQFLYSGRLPINFDERDVINKSNLGKYDWSDITSFKGIIQIPYTCSTMSIFENYTSNIPMFFPSLKFMMQLYQNYSDFVLSELTWNRIFGTSRQSIIDCDRENDPNRFDNLEIMEKWISLSDFYNQEWMPHLIYFDSFEDLAQKLVNTDLVGVNKQMEEFNKKRKELIYSKWSNLIDKING